MEQPNKPDAKPAPRFGIDPRTGKLMMGSYGMRLPQSRGLRIAIGIVLVILGCLGFLPILGFWMVPLGLLVLSNDLAMVRRRRRRLSVWWNRRRQARRHDAS
ncbi:hypothetical protein SAMN05880582_101811 [Rhizobium sp. RU20A]|uniref:hypothetical protein n=1 Tax=Rhizobium sp. RU20A TaxID=1907412 RepID=UPI000954AB22|nr:hypothetical protein [Rhizobium sp. RU20A]SIQ11990.1 hypothetical protein SAMN05880582_101811 [Rhizobium sp. RU20A]